MSEPPIQTQAPEHHSLPEQVAAEAVAVANEAVKAVRRIPLHTRLAIVAISLIAGIAALLIAVRYVALLPQAHLLIEAGGLNASEKTAAEREQEQHVSRGVAPQRQAVTRWSQETSTAEKIAQGIDVTAFA